MKRVGGIKVTALGAALLGAAIGVSGCGSGGGSALGTGAAVHTASISGRLMAPAGTALEGTTIVAEQLLGGRTPTVRAIAATNDAASRSAMVARVQSGAASQLPGVYTTTAMADGSFLFRDLPAGEYCLTARHGDLIGVLSGMRVGGAHTAASGSVVRLTAGGTINGKIRYAHPNETTPDNSGILAFIQGTSLLGYTQGSSGDYSIGGVPMQSDTDTFYTVVAVAGGFADTEIMLHEHLVAASATAPLIFLQLGVDVNGRISDPTITNIDRQGLGGVVITAATGQSATTDENGFFQLRGLPAGSNFLTIVRNSYKTIRQQIGPLEGGVATFLNITMQRA
jgi:hypothetical protein